LKPIKSHEPNFTRIRLHNITTPKFAILALQTACKCYRPLQRLRQHDGVTIQRCSAADVAWSGPRALPSYSDDLPLYIRARAYTCAQSSKTEVQTSHSVTVPLIQWVCSTVLLCGWYSYKN